MDAGVPLVEMTVIDRLENILFHQTVTTGTITTSKV
jgi:hypothetical protein